jgi:SAM-dependent methyltransferase
VTGAGQPPGSDQVRTPTANLWSPLLSAELTLPPQFRTPQPAGHLGRPEQRSTTPLRLNLICCPLCGKSEEVPIAVGEDFEYRTSPDTFLAVRCLACGLVYLRLQPDHTELGRIYPPEYHAFDFSAEKYGFAWAIRRRLEARRLLGFCRGLPAGARILDAGCGDGFHLKLLREFGNPTWQLEGVDTSAIAVAAARQSGFQVHHGPVEFLGRSGPGYDLALLIATIEHVPEPAKVLASVKALLRPGGRVAIVTDNAAAWSQRLFQGRHWGGYHFPRHFCLFDARTLRRLADLAGLEVARLGTMVSPVNWVYSIRNLLVDLRAPEWSINQFSLASSGSLAVFTLLGMVQQLLGRGELLAAEFRRPEHDHAE